PSNAPRASGSNTVLHGIFSQMPYNMTRAAAGNLRFVVFPGFPQARHMCKPQMPGLNIDGHLPDVMLHVWILNFLLRGYVVQRKLVCRFRCAHESRRVMRNEAGLPTFCYVLSGVPDPIFVG